MKRSGSQIYTSTSDLESAYRRLAADDLPDETKEVIRRFVNTWIARGVTRSRGVKLVYSLKRLAFILGKPFQDASRDDLIDLVGRLEGVKLAERTKYDLKVVLKTFYRWLKGGEDEQIPREVAWLKPRLRNRSHKLPEDLLTETEVLAMAQAATAPREKALILTLYESGCRIGELLSLKVKNVSFDQFGAVLRVTGKTGDRRVRIISSAPALASWLDHYEGASDPEAYLWPPRSNSNHDTHYPAIHSSICKTLNVLAAKAGIKKHVHAHLFRHSRATALANKLTEAQMKEYFGWTQSSNMASVYVHLSGRDVDNALLALQGFAKPPDPQEETMKLCFCPRCREKNAPSAKYCLKCGTPMQEQTIRQIEDEKKAGNNLMDQLMQDTEFKEFLHKKVIALGLDKQIA